MKCVCGPVWECFHHSMQMLEISWRTCVCFIFNSKSCYKSPNKMSSSFLKHPVFSTFSRCAYIISWPVDGAVRWFECVEHEQLPMMNVSGECPAGDIPWMYDDRIGFTYPTSVVCEFTLWRTCGHHVVVLTEHFCIHIQLSSETHMSYLQNIRSYRLVWVGAFA
jgi:hypothetical protein